MDKIETVLFALTCGAYALSLFSSVLRQQGWKSLLTIGIVLHAGLIGYRWDLSGHPPIMGTYEACLSDAWFTSAILLYLGSRNARMSRAAPVLLPLVLVLLIYGLIFPTAHYPLTISERGLWVDVHALLAYWAWGLYAAALSAAILLLIKGKNPGHVALDGILHHLTNLGFLFQSMMMAAGAYYGWRLFGDWWRWDPVESLALVSWISWALVLHMRLFYGWRDRRAAWLTVVAFVLLLVSYKILVYLPAGSTFHIFDLRF